MVHENGWKLHPAIHSSNLLRGWETASIIAKAIDEIESVEGFDELAERGLGSAANLSVEQIERVLKQDPRFEMPPADWKSNSHYRLPLQGAESLMMAGGRIAEHVRQTMAKFEGAPGEPVAQVFVGHGAAFRHAAHILGALAFDEIKKLSMYHATPVALQKFQDGSYRRVAGEWKIRSQQENAD
jgi:broad specificity phosphatase PhoE